MVDSRFKFAGARLVGTCRIGARRIWLPLPLTSTLADTAEAPLGTFAACEETRC
jgi:hypothetical protein